MSGMDAVEAQDDPFHPDHERLEQYAEAMDAYFAREGFKRDHAV